eukprot:TRINITY_DN2310_c0_g1_i1.p2 TRINITY_DN2310_c0_g1~~TRINITY_DN2310_c0_g1_i1.p2  ORF type:complete len:103 (+),score=10.06 TRINITY_DN2310_c0_g1_i1:319-627(+)
MPDTPLTVRHDLQKAGFTKNYAPKLKTISTFGALQQLLREVHEQYLPWLPEDASPAVVAAVCDCPEALEVIHLSHPAALNAADSDGQVCSCPSPLPCPPLVN